MPKDPIDLSDPRAIKAVAHPARWRVIEELYSGRTLTATQAGELCGLTGSAMSYHLRTLERFGLITRAAPPDSTTPADRRERPWRAAGGGLNISPLERTPANQVTARASMANVVESIQRMLLVGPPSTGDAFGTSVTHGRLQLTDEQAKELDERVRQLIEEFEQTEEPAGPDAPPLREFFWLRGNDPSC